MKKALAILLSILMILSLAACGSNPDDKTDGTQGVGESNSPTPNGTADNETVETSKYPLPELVPDGDYSVDLDTERVIYDKDGIRVTYKYCAMGDAPAMDNNLELYFDIENTTVENLWFIPCSAVINGMSVQLWTENDPQNPHSVNETRTYKVYVSSDTVFHKEDVKCLDIYFGFISGTNEYGVIKTLVAPDLSYSFTEGQHDHRNDNRSIDLEMIYENDEIAVYLEKSFFEEDDDYYSNYAVVNKTSKNLQFDSSIECKYNIAPPSNHYTNLSGTSYILAPNSYVQGKVYIVEEWSDLDMTELVFRNKSYYATQAQMEVANLIAEYTYAESLDICGKEILEVANCYDEQFSVSVTVTKE